MKDAIFTGRDLAEALRAAEAGLGIRAEHLRYVVLDEGSEATASRGASPARIAVMLDAAAGKASREAPSVAPSRAEPRDGGFEGSLSAVNKALATALDMEIALTSHADADRIGISVEGAGAQALEDPDGETLLALETILQRIASRNGEKRRVVVANPARRSVREAGLREQALRLAADVKERGLPRMMPPLNSYERRIVHMALAEVQGIKTYSVGDGMERRLTIALASEPTAE